MSPSGDMDTESSPIPQILITPFLTSHLLHIFSPNKINKVSLFIAYLYLKTITEKKHNALIEFIYKYSLEQEYFVVLFCTRKSLKKIQKYQQDKNFYKEHADMLKLESALVFRDLEGIAVCRGFRNHRLIIFILDRSEKD